MRIVWSDRAIDRLRSIHDFIAQESVQGASSVLRGIFESTERLRQFPNSGRVVSEYPETDLREIISSPYRIIYRVQEEHIEIVNVLHSRQQL